jgi:hypothetical protein
MRKVTESPEIAADPEDEMFTKLVGATLAKAALLSKIPAPQKVVLQ